MKMSLRLSAQAFFWARSQAIAHDTFQMSSRTLDADITWS